MNVFGLVLFWLLCVEPIPVPISTAMTQDLERLASEEMAGRWPGTPGHAKARAYILKRFEALGLKAFEGGYSQTFELEYYKKTYTGYNLVAYIEGKSKSNRKILIGAHYDHLGTRRNQIYNGADDNAAGVAAMLAVAAYFVQNQPKHDLVFVAFDLEELGLRGAAQFSEKPPFPLDDIAWMVNLDMIARPDNGLLYAVGSHQHPVLRELLAEVDPPGGIKLAFGHDKPDQSGRDYWVNLSDQYPFHKKGVPFVYFAVEDHEDYHQPSDTVDRIDPKVYLEASTIVLNAVMAFDR